MTDQKQGKGFFKKPRTRMLLLAIVAFLILQKDFSFNLNLSAPSHFPEEEQPISPTIPSIPKPNAKESKITEQQADQSESPSTSSLLPSTHSTNEQALKRLKKIKRAVHQAYIRRFSRVAIDEMNKFNIPASIILGQAMLNSLAGTSEPARLGNNHFHLNCKKWTGKKLQSKEKICYRKYESPWSSFRNHSQYITTGTFKKLKSISKTDYKAWAKGLEKARYSNNKSYAKQLIKTIELYDLHRFDL